MCSRTSAESCHCVFALACVCPCMCVCLCLFMCVCVCACVSSCACARVRLSVSVRVRVRVMRLCCHLLVPVCVCVCVCPCARVRACEGTSDANREVLSIYKVYLGFRSDYMCITLMGRHGQFCALASSLSLSGDRFCDITSRMKIDAPC